MTTTPAMTHRTPLDAARVALHELRREQLSADNGRPLPVLFARLRGEAARHMESLCWDIGITGADPSRFAAMASKLRGSDPLTVATLDGWLRALAADAATADPDPAVAAVSAARACGCIPPGFCGICAGASS